MLTAHTTGVHDMTDSTLKALDKAERKAWNTMMNGSEADSRTVFGEEGKNYVAWCKAADACRHYRERLEALAA
jgi:hypothetical protein